MAAELTQRERALRPVPSPYSLALRLRGADVSAELIRLFVDIEPAALDRLHRMAEAKLVAAKNATDDRYHGCQ
jgi:hypothetical protein